MTRLLVTAQAPSPKSSRLSSTSIHSRIHDARDIQACRDCTCADRRCSCCRSPIRREERLWKVDSLANLTSLLLDEVNPLNFQGVVANNPTCITLSAVLHSRLAAALKNPSDIGDAVHDDSPPLDPSEVCSLYSYVPDASATIERQLRSRDASTSRRSRTAASMRRSM